ncbi:putative oleoyl-[acyl-carrier-protein] hydrolase [Helianthus annuus]|nr:putative oleoyl-[acyl-carrier-protein] hydrolase [Helianthus annuus]KAJ0744919.1 putative oleoyl-[acyl-carrier-protein] hydrolase [Helianthus annuus]KAJ0881080.1 putative oleoyl-[acyl-carrier-protein] hydrolase [Helianthus annuus]KAJ0885123.1 putative oleoyl-[acyl-carrier-protein] hydrolase [Helianthus annuus]
MVAMAASTYFFLNSFSYHDMTRNNLRGTPRPKDAHGIIKKNDGSSRSLLAKDLTKVNATKVRSNRASFLKPIMMLGQNKNYLDMIPELGIGSMLSDGFVFRQKFQIRSYEVGSDQAVTIETLMNLLQETSINHLKAIGVWSDGFGLTREMCKKNLIWVVSKLQVAVDRYPIWDDVIQIDTWKGAYGKIGICSNWTICDAKTGEILLTASCILVMMNEETRKLSKFPDEVRSELDEHLTNVILPVVARKWSPRDEMSIVDHVRNGIMPRWSDLDMNQHVNNVKYIGWILESVPHSIVENYELASLTLEYHQECKLESVVQSHTYVMVSNNGKIGDYDLVDCKHALQLETGGGEIMRGWSIWRPKQYGNRLGLE